MKRKSLRRFFGWFLFAYLLFALLASIFPYVPPKVISEQSKALLLAAEQRSREQETGGRVALIESPEDAFNVRVELLRAAERQVDFVCYALRAGESSASFLAELARAADRGVQVRILLDGKAGTLFPQVNGTIEALNQHENIECRRYNAVNLLRPWKWHSLLHDKFLLVDGELLLLGGRNIGDRFFAPAGYTGDVAKDRDVLAQGKSAIESLENYLSQLWNHEATKPYSERKSSWRKRLDRLVSDSQAFAERNPEFYRKSLDQYLEQMVPATSIRLLHNPIDPGRKEPWLANQLLDLARQGKETIVLSTPYATANTLLLDTLSEAGQNAELCLVTNSMVSTSNYPAFSNYYFNRDRFLATGLTIYEYRGESSLHGKSMVIDNRISAVGSFNLDDRSAYINTESVLIIDSPEFAKILTSMLEEQIQESTSFHLNTDENTGESPIASFGKRLLMFLTYLFFWPAPFLL